MATLLQALAPFAGEARHAERRRELSVAAIVDVRRDFPPGVAASFGQFLASFRLSHPVPAGISLRQLALTSTPNRTNQAGQASPQTCSASPVRA
jgi:hypothetical protein